MQTENIEKFLQRFSDDALRRLEEDARVGNVPYSSCERCLLGHHQDGYNMCSPIAYAAEREYHALVSYSEFPRTEDYVERERLLDWHRCQNLLPLVQQEKLRREAAKPIPFEAVVKVEEAVEELVCA